MPGNIYDAIASPGGMSLLSWAHKVAMLGCRRSEVPSRSLAKGATNQARHKQKFQDIPKSDS